ncbi:STAS domain-containing protein [Nonomuraea sp. NN258]|uniref:STAS domain-containing protein n=1 Tax=Nonomuraea antri TaxID=2730852 RepID=UPI001568FD22|nr:STAS domain-containing protein [Nonomuraea antri]NRQ33697.1 STAS domain-containing protein [Nonomuraea antri]
MADHDAPLPIPNEPATEPQTEPRTELQDVASLLLALNREIARLTAPQTDAGTDRGRAAAQRAQQARDRAAEIAERLARDQHRLREDDPGRMDMVSPLRLTSENLPGGLLVRVAGEVDLTNAARLEAYLDQARRRQGEPLVLDLSGLTFLDHRGLNVLLRAHVHAERHGGGLHLAALRAMPARLLEVAGAWRHLRWYPSVEDALTALTS